MPGENLRAWAERMVTWLPRALQGLREMQWEVAQTLLELEESGAYREAGYTSLHELVAELGMSKTQAARLLRAARFARESGLGERLRAVSPEVADAFRRVPEEELPEVLELFTQHPLSVAWQEFHDRWGPERLRRFHIVRYGRDGSAVVIRVRARSEEELRPRIGAGDVVIRGGVVVEGQVLEEDE